jgi:hypothetical protein
MAPGKRFLRTAGLIMILLVGLAYLVVSFHPRLRFADPTPDEPLEVKRNYPCYHDMIYGESAARDVLYFGASKTHHSVDAGLVGAYYRAVTGEELGAFAFDTPNSNPELVYAFFRDYLASNPAPEIAFFELTSLFPLPPPIRYMHPLFADLAPPYLYLDVLEPGGVVDNRLFAVSDFFRLLIRHIDLSLSRLLIADVRFVVPAGDNCEAPTSGGPDSSAARAGRPSFAQLLDEELEKHVASLDPDAVGDKAVLLETYADKPLMTGYIDNWNEKRRARFERNFWFGGKRMKARSIDYYQRVIALGRAYGVEVAFYFLPNLYSPATTGDAISRVSASIGAPVYTLPYPVAQVSYHFYKDPAHVTPRMRPAFAIWFASLIDKVKNS